MKPKWVYLVYCNPEPIVYAVYSSMNKAIKYAESLIEYRKPTGFYHYNNFSKTKDIKDYHDLEKLIFFACLICNGSEYEKKYYDKCYVKVIRKRLN